MEECKIRIAKRCPKCNFRLCDKVSPATGCVEFKCPRCGHVIVINLALRRTVPNRCLRTY